MSLLRLLLALMVVSLLTLTGCTRIEEGNYGVLQNWDRSYVNAPVTGVEFEVLGTLTEVYGRERLIQVQDVRPKDKENVMLQDLDLTVSFRSNPNKAVEFLRQRQDLVRPSDLRGVAVLGETYVRKDAQSVIGETVRRFTSEEILNNKRGLEEAFRTDLQQELDTLYGKDVFFIDEVKISNIIVAPSIEERIQAVALINAEKTKAEATARVLEVRQDIQTREMRLIAEVAKASGLTVDQVLEARRLDLLRDLPAGTSVLVNSDRTP